MNTPSDHSSLMTVLSQCSEPSLSCPIAKELQNRIGLIPILKENYEIFVLRPQSVAEICRVVRAAKTLRLAVRATTGDIALRREKITFAEPKSVLIDCSGLRDKPQIYFCHIRRKGVIGEVPALRVLASVTMNQLMDFMVHHCCQFQQGFELQNEQSSVVGSVVSGKPGLAIHEDPYVGSCLGDEIICIRIVNNEGDLVEYSSEADLKFAVTNYGCLGIVYDVAFRYQPLSICRVNHEYKTWKSILDHKSLSELIKNNWLTEFIYIPMNECPEGSDAWDPMEDFVLVKTARESKNKTDEPDDPLMAEARFQIPIIDPVFGPTEKCYIDAFSSVEETKALLKCCFQHQRRLLACTASVRQFTPWAFNSTQSVSFSTENFTLSVSISETFIDFDNLVVSLMKEMQNFADDGEEFPLNVGMKVQFSREFLQDYEDPLDCQRLLAHFKFSTVAACAERSPLRWKSFIEKLYQAAKRVSGRVLISWNSQWPSEQILIENFQEAFKRGCRRKLCEFWPRVDRDGMFLNQTLEKILIPQMNSYQKIYRNKLI